jgi:hypothetical protein
MLEGTIVRLAKIPAPIDTRAGFGVGHVKFTATRHRSLCPHIRRGRRGHAMLALPTVGDLPCRQSSFAHPKSKPIPRTPKGSR